MTNAALASLITKDFIWQILFNCLLWVLLWVGMFIRTGGRGDR